MPGAGVACAQAAATPINQIIAAKVHARRIEVSRIKTHNRTAPAANRRAPVHRGSQENSALACACFRAVGIVVGARVRLVLSRRGSALLA